MNNKIFRKFFISVILSVLGIGLFWTNVVFAQNLEIEFEKTPLFDEANFLPGQNIIRWVKVTNNSGETKRIATEAINVNNSDRLGDVFILEITEGSETRYKNDLSRFFNEGEAYLSDLASGSSTTYNFSIDFYPETNNNFQGKTLGFDILIGFQGEEGGLPPGSGSGGGGYLPPGLTITNETTEKIEEVSVTISWETNYSSTSQVVYDTVPGQFDLSFGSPNYGYAQITPEYDVSSKVKSHSVTISGLIPGTKYYYRCISHASLAISKEHSFTTITEIEEEDTKGKIGEKVVVKEKIEKWFAQGQTEEAEEGSKTEEESKGVVEQEVEEEVEEEKSETVLGKLLAAIGGFFDLENFWWILLFLIFVMVILFLLSKERRSRRDEEV